MVASFSSQNIQALNSSAVQWTYPCTPPCSTLKTQCYSTGAFGFWTKCQKTVTYYDAATLVNHQDIESSSTFFLSRRISNWWQGVKETYTPFSIQQSALGFLVGVGGGILYHMQDLWQSFDDNSYQSPEEVPAHFYQLYERAGGEYNYLSRKYPNLPEHFYFFPILKTLAMGACLGACVEEILFRKILYDTLAPFLQKVVFGVEETKDTLQSQVVRTLLVSALFAYMHLNPNHSESLRRNYLSMAFKASITYHVLYHFWGIWGAMGAHMARNFLVVAGYYLRYQMLSMTKPLRRIW